MSVEVVGEDIDVVAVFKNGLFEPRKFRWRGREHRVSDVNARWAEHDGSYRVYRFAVATAAHSFYEISLHTKHMRWSLDRFMPGEP